MGSNGYSVAKNEGSCDTCGVEHGQPCVALRNRGDLVKGEVLGYDHDSRRMAARFGSGRRAAQTQTNAPVKRADAEIDQALARGARVFEIMREFGVTEDVVYARMDHLQIRRAG